MLAPHCWQTLETLQERRGVAVALHAPLQHGSSWFPQPWQVLEEPHCNPDWHCVISQQGCPLPPHWSLHVEVEGTQ